MKTLLFALVVTVGLAARATDPSVTVASVSQDPATRIVTVSYTLANGPAVVTLSDVRTNGVSIGAAHFRSTWGDINRKVAAPEEGSLSFRWIVDHDWLQQAVAAGQLEVRLAAWPAGDGPDWMFVNLQMTNDVRYYEHEALLPHAVTSKVCKTDRLVLKLVRPRAERFLMGSPIGEFGRDAATTVLATEQSTAVGKETLHPVRLTKNYYLGVYPVTQGQYEDLLCWGWGAAETWGNGEDKILKRSRPSQWGTYHAGGHYTYRERPVENVSYERLTTPQGKAPEYSFFKDLADVSGLTFQLPTEAEWEYACRAGTTTGLSSGRETTASDAACANVAAIGRYADNGGTNLSNGYGESGNRNIIWQYGFSPDVATPYVGTYAPNAWGFYDMLGGVWEMCRDTYAADLGSAAADDPLNAAADDPLNAAAGDAIVVRGGAYNEKAGACRSASRGGLPKAAAYRGAGFRLCLEL